MGSWEELHNQSPGLSNRLHLILPSQEPLPKRGERPHLTKLSISVLTFPVHPPLLVHHLLPSAGSALLGLGL